MFTQPASSSLFSPLESIFSSHISVIHWGQTGREKSVFTHVLTTKAKKVVPIVSSLFRILFHTLIHPHSWFHYLTWYHPKLQQKGLKLGTSNAVIFTKILSLAPSISVSLCLCLSVSVYKKIIKLDTCIYFFGFYVIHCVYLQQMCCSTCRRMLATNQRS